MTEQQPGYRALIDMRDERDDLSIRISLLKDIQQSDPAQISRLERDMELLDRRIARHGPPKSN
jgi:hypothetical protein